LTNLLPNLLAQHDQHVVARVAAVESICNLASDINVEGGQNGVITKRTVPGVAIPTD
jgi:hypothetical protein